MKDKPIKHRLQNTFRFKSFQKRVKDIKISSRKYLLQRVRSDADSQTEFSQSIQKWNELNLTTGFKEFKKEVGNNNQTLSQLLLNESHIADVLQRHLESSDCISLSPLLHALVAFASDIPENFFKSHFYTFLAILPKHLTTRCHETIEEIFVCYVSLFTLGQRFIKGEIVKLYHEEKYAQLLAKSYPWYVNELAAQSLGFLVRKLPNRRNFFLMAFGKLKKDSTQKEGVGRLIFHTIKSDVTRRLHSSVSNTLSILLDLLKEESVPIQASTESIEYSFHKLTEHVTSKSDIKEDWRHSWAEDSRLVWQPIWHKISTVCTVEDESDEHLNALLQIALKLIQYKCAILVLDVDYTVEQMINVICNASSHETFLLINSILIKLVSSSHHSLSHTSLRSVFDHMISLKVPSEISLSFIEQLNENSMYDDEVFPRFLKYSTEFLSQNIDLNCRKQLLNSLTTIILSRQSPNMAGGDLDSWKRCPLNVAIGSSSDLSLFNFLEEILSLDLDEDPSNSESIILACICIPHIGPLDIECFVPSLFYIINESLDILSKNSSHNLSEKTALCIIGYAVEALYHIIPADDFINAFSQTSLFQLLVNEEYKDNLYALKSLNIFMHVLSNSPSADCERWMTFEEAYKLLHPMLSSPKPLVRLLVSKILSSYKSSKSGIFSLMVEVESVPVTPWEYKDRLRCLNNLDYDHIHRENEEFETACILFLIGQLHINFREIWPPVRKYISSYANGLKIGHFWPIWLNELQKASELSYKELCGNLQDNDDLEFESPILSSLHSLGSTHSGFVSLPTKSSFLHFRDQLWLSMSLFPDVCERRNRDVVSLFFDFLYKEYFPADVNVAPTQDISRHITANENNEDVLEESLNETGDLELEKVDEELESESRIRRAPTGTLCNHVSLFAKFRNPKQMHRSKDSLEIFKEFLSHPYLPAQKLAIDAIMAYNFKYLNPYKESLYRILDDKTFKEEITLFSIDGTNEDGEHSLKEEHRKDFMPILMRILYGKMMYKTGSNSSGKGKSSFRKGVVIRFLAGASEAELNTFLDQTFDVFLSYLEGSSLDVVKRVMSTTDPKKVVPLKRIHGAFRTLETIIDKLANLVSDRRGFFLKVLLFILSTSVTLLENRVNVSHHYYNFLKNLRQLSLLKIISFFEVYNEYPWSPDEVEALYMTGVWPALPRLPDEGIYNPTTLMKLFLCWASNPRYHCLLARYKNDSTFTPLPYIMKLIHHPKCTDKVIDSSFLMIEKLLTKPQIEDGAEAPPPPLPQDHLLDIESLMKEKGLFDLTFGESLVALHLDEILQVMKARLSSGSLSKRGLSILIHVAEWIKSKDTGEDFLSIIVPLLLKNKVKDEDKVCFLLQISSNLLKIVDSPKVHLNAFLQMFSIISGRQARDCLIQVIDVMAQRVASYSQLSDWCGRLNSWNVKMVDEIDFETRLSCYREINENLESCSEMNEEIIIFLINNNFWSLKETSDAAIRESSLLCLQNMLKMLSRLQAKQPSAPLIEEHLLPHIKVGLKHAKEKVRRDMLILIQTAATNCHSYVPKLEDLFKLTDTHDSENDFFLNMCHLQLHRRARALNKLCEKLKDDSLKLQKETILEFLLPLTASFLFKDEYSKDDYLISSVVSTMGCLAKQLNWIHYKNLLMFYLNLMSHELKFLKVGVHVLEAIIDAFHENQIGTEVNVSYDTNQDANTTPRTNNNKALKIYATLTKVIIPQIQNTLASRSLRDTEHKVNKRKYPEEKDIKRIPLALALVKLLKKLPQQALDDNVDGVLMKLITFLKSQSDSIREQARSMLVKVMAELGGNYFTNLVTDMKNLLTRGFHSHILIFTLHAIIAEMQTDLLPDHIGGSLENMMELCIQNLFGDQAEEKDVAQIVNKFKEVKAERNFAIVGLLSQLIAANHLELLILPLKQVLQSQDKKVINKVVTCLQKIANGLERNPNILLSHKTLFIYGLLNERICEVSQKKITNELKTSQPHQPDSFLLLPEPRKVGLKPKTSPRDTSYVLIEFSLKLLHVLLRHDYYEVENTEHCGYLDPFVSPLKQCLKTEYPEINVLAVHILTWLLKYTLPSLKEQINFIVGQLFVILNKYSSTNLTKGKTYELVQVVFNTLAVILKDYPDISFEDEHLIVLIHYARDNIEDFDQIHSTYSILNALIHRKVENIELHKLMKTVKELSIVSKNINMLDQARSCYFKYFMNYPKRKKQHVSTFMYYISNLSYPILEGRLSALLMANDVLAKYPHNLMPKDVELAACSKIIEELVCEDSKEHKRLFQKALKTLYLKSTRKESLINLSFNSFTSSECTKSEEATRITMGSQAFCNFLDAPFEAHPSTLLPALAPKVVDLLAPSLFKASGDPDDELVENDQLSALDASLNSLLELFTRMVEVFMTPKTMNLWDKHVDNIVWDHIKDHLLYPNLQTRVLASSLLSQYFSHYSLEKHELPVFPPNPKVARSLVLDLCEQLATEASTDKPLLDQLSLAVVRNLVYMIRLSESMSINPPLNQDDNKEHSASNDDAESTEKDILCRSSLWVLERASKLAYRELKLYAKTSTLCREAFLNLIAGIAMVLKDKFIGSPSLVPFVLHHVARELEDKNLPESLVSRTHELASLLKDILGVEKYNEEYIKVQLKIARKKLERKTKDHERVITNPQVAMKKRAKKHAAKKESKKRKFAELKLKPNKKRNLRDMALVVG